MARRSLLTSESVTEGHPDKIADQISDAVLDELYREDHHARVAVETLLTSGLVVVAGEISSTARVDIQAIARQVLRDIGYAPEFGCDPETCSFVVRIDPQSQNIAHGVDNSFESRAGTTTPSTDRVRETRG